MTANLHPFDTPYTDRDASALLAATKLHIPMSVADADEVRNTDLSLQFGGIRVLALNSFFKINTGDTQADDGINVIIDGAGTHFVRAVELVSPTQSTYTDADVIAGAITIADNDSFAIIDTTSQVNVNVPAAAARTGLPLTIIDKGGHGFVPVMAGAETLNDGVGSIYTVSTPNGWVSILPISGGYRVSGAQL